MAAEPPTQPDGWKADYIYLPDVPHRIKPLHPNSPRPPPAGMKKGGKMVRKPLVIIRSGPAAQMPYARVYRGMNEGGVVEEDGFSDDEAAQRSNEEVQAMIEADPRLLAPRTPPREIPRPATRLVGGRLVPIERPGLSAERVAELQGMLPEPNWEAAPNKKPRMSKAGSYIECLKMGGGGC